MIQNMAFTPPEGLLNTTTYPATPASETAARELLQALPMQLREYINNVLLPALSSVATGSSGADSIGSAAISGVESSPGVAATTVRDQIVGVKAIADTAVAGELTPGSINDPDMFASGVVTQSAIAGGAVGASQLSENAVTEVSIQNGTITKAKLNVNALQWTLVVTSGILTGASTLTIPSQAGKAEIMLQIRPEAGDMVVASATAILDSSGLIVPSGGIYVYGMNIGDPLKVDYRIIKSNSATQLSIGTSVQQILGGNTFLQKLYVYVR